MPLQFHFTKFPAKAVLRPGHGLYLDHCALTGRKYYRIDFRTRDGADGRRVRLRMAINTVDKSLAMTVRDTAVKAIAGGMIPNIAAWRKFAKQIRAHLSTLR